MSLSPQVPKSLEFLRGVHWRLSSPSLVPFIYQAPRSYSGTSSITTGDVSAISCVCLLDRPLPPSLPVFHLLKRSTLYELCPYIPKSILLSLISRLGSSKLFVVVCPCILQQLFNPRHIPIGTYSTLPDRLQITTRHGLLPNQSLPPTSKIKPVGGRYSCSTLVSSSRFPFHTLALPWPRSYQRSTKTHYRSET
jgi:hypothetical protein